MIYTSKAWSTARRRWVGGTLAAVVLAAMAVLYSLSPTDRGRGTHRQLGLSPCASIVQTGYPCVGCGVTTSLTAMSRGRFVYAAQCHLFGVFAFLAVIALGMMGAAQAISGRNFLKIVRIGVWKWYSLAGVVVLLGGWKLKLAIGIADGTYPIGR
ncbi:MAG: DUF2752 domain-containing protein [Phycisphaerales bacterium]|jgi:hypothetical protein|nr:DUF2752 domain-containing protein [Phycisphaerales bacterium]MBT7171984.1 DUF2752 domain-containing protein [Phycisphaerales bacterium]